ncbi:TonB-dependent receptor [Flavobacteriaceae bacterium]|nr:TonB-dependent receptor [Flavobacteriaceae bacterium]
MKHKNIILLLLLISSLSFAQQAITGTVKSAEDQQPLPEVTILVKGTSTGVSTNFDGEYTINAPLNSTLVFSYVGFLTQEVALNNQKIINVNLQENISKLDEILLVGYGTQKKSDITGSVASVKVGDLTSIPLARTDEVLQGQVPGVQVVSSDASPNANVSIRIRGVSSINGGSDPLIIIDGVQGGVLSDVHPNDIQSMEVLKDASATAIYGSRGSSGVILVTTKKGKNHKPTLSYNTYTTFHEVRKTLDLLSPSQYSKYVNSVRTSNGQPLVFSDDDIAGFDAGGGTDWQDAIFKSGITQNHHISVRGGNDNVNYNIAGDYLDIQGIIRGTSFRKYSLRPNIELSLSPKLQLKLNSFYSSSKDNPTPLNTRGDQGSPVYAALLFSPTKSIFEPDGSYSQPGGVDAGPVTEYNPVALAKEPIRNNFSRRIILNPSIEYEILEGLKVNIIGSYQSIQDENNFYINKNINPGATRQASIYNGFWQRYQNTNILTYQKTLGDKHDLKFTGVFEQQTTIFNETTATASGFLSDAVTYNDLGLGQESQSYSGGYEDSIESYLARLNYGFDGKYLLTLSGRYDGASVFSTNNKWGFFPSAALGWNVSKEEFLRDSNTINNLKIRGSYGEVGNAAILPYQSLDKLQSGANFAFNGETLTNGVIINPQAGNNTLKWETTEQLNIGLDLSLFHSRLSLVADYYKKNTTDLLLEKSLLQASGFKTQLVNAGEVENKGFEIGISAIPVINDNFKWNTNVTFSKNNNEIIALNEGEERIILENNVGPGFNEAFTLEAGSSIGDIKGVVYDGVWKSDEAILAAAYNTAPGAPKYIDQNNDGIINTDDNVTIGSALPDFTFGWNNNFSYKNLSLNILVIGVQGNEIYNVGRYFTESPDRDGTSTALLNAWTPTNQDTNIPSSTAILKTTNSSRWIEDGSYIRIKNITLGYNFSNTFIEFLNINSARIYFTGTNLFTFTDYTGFDPEANASTSATGRNTDSYAGVDLATYPSQKKITLGLDIKF